jgi:hypothetical protein
VGDEKINPLDRGFTALEAALTEMAIPFAGPAAAALAEQLAKAEVVKRDMTGVGSFTTIRVPEGCPLVAPHPAPPFSPAGARIGKKGHLLSSILWFEGGRLACIELHLLDAPDDPIDLSTVQFAVEAVWPLQDSHPTLH